MGCLLLGMAGSWIGCGGGGEPSAAPPSEWQIDSVWALRPDDLARIRLMRVASGRLLATERGNPSLMAIRLRDDSALVFGRPGQGPGDLVSITDVFVRKDSVFVLDGTYGRLQRFVLGAGSARADGMWSLPRGFGTAMRVFVHRSGAIVVAFSSGAPRRGTVPDMQVFRDSLLLVEFDRQSLGTGRIIGSVPGMEYVFVTMPDVPRTFAVPPFSATTHFEMLDTGIVVADGRTGAVSLRRWDGAVTLLAPPDTAYAPVLDHELAASRARAESAAVRVSMRDPAAGERARRLASAATEVWGGRPPRPRLEGLLTDGRTVAVQRYAFGDPASVEWDMMRIDGTPLGRMVVPGRLRFFHLANDTIAAVSRDSLDVESLLLLRFRLRP